MFRALTVKQPWASLIVEGKKPVENRGWRVNWRGLILIHASKEFDLDGYELLRSRNVIRRTPEKFVKGAIVGAALLRDCLAYARTENPDEWHEPGQIGWYFEDAVEFETPLPISGRQGLWLAPVDLNVTQPDPEAEDPESAPRVVLATLLDQLGRLGGSDNAKGRGTILA